MRGRIGERREDVLTAQLVLLHHRFNRHSTGQLRKHEIYGDAGPFDDRLAKPDRCVDRDPWCDLHWSPPSAPRPHLTAAWRQARVLYGLRLRPPMRSRRTPMVRPEPLRVGGA